MGKTQPTIMGLLIVVCAVCVLWTAPVAAEVSQLATEKSPSEPQGEVDPAPEPESSEQAPEVAEPGPAQPQPNPSAQGSQAAPPQQTTEDQAAEAPVEGDTEQQVVDGAEAAVDSDEAQAQAQDVEPVNNAVDLLSDIRSTSGVNWSLVSLGVR